MSKWDLSNFDNKEDAHVGFQQVPENRTAVDNILRLNYNNQLRLTLMADTKGVPLTDHQLIDLGIIILAKSSMLATDIRSWNKRQSGFCTELVALVFSSTNKRNVGSANRLQIPIPGIINQNSKGLPMEAFFIFALHLF